MYSIKYLVSSKDIIDEEDLEREKKDRCRICFSGLKPQKSKRTHIILFFTRRFLLASMVFLLADLPMMIKLGVFTGIQLLYLAINIIQRPFVHKKDQITEIINEVIYLIYLILILYLFFFNDRNDWSSFAKYSYIGLMMANFTIIFIVSFSKFTIELMI